MSVKFFGQFLLEHNVVTRQQLLEAIEYQEQENLRFGEYAVKHGYMSEEDVAAIQAEQQRADKLFGEAAVDKGILTAEQIDEILTRQRNDHVYIGQALVEKGFLTESQLREQLDGFRDDQAPYVSEGVSLPDGVANPEAVETSADLTVKMLRRVVGLSAKAGAATMGPAQADETFAIVCIEFSGAINYRYLLLTPEAPATEIASRVIGEDISGEGPAVVVDGVKEFCNIVCGNVMAKLAQQGKAVDISPPLEASASAQAGSQAIRIPVATTLGPVTLAIIED